MPAAATPLLVLYRQHQQFGKEEAYVCAHGIAEEAYGNARAYYSLVFHRASYDWHKGWRANQRDAGGKRRVGVYAEQGTQQDMHEERAERGYSNKEKDIGVDIAQRTYSNLQCHGNRENKNEVGACLKGALHGANTLVG